MIQGSSFIPINLAALHLLSPATISYPFLAFLRTIGCISPCSSIDEASSCSFSSSKVFLGCPEFGFILFISIYSIPPASCGNFSSFISLFTPSLSGTPSLLDFLGYPFSSFFTLKDTSASPKSASRPFPKPRVFFGAAIYSSSSLLKNSSANSIYACAPVDLGSYCITGIP